MRSRFALILAATLALAGFPLIAPAPVAAAPASVLPDGGPALAWTRTFRTGHEESLVDVATDATGRVFVTGWTKGTLPSQVRGGGADAFVRAYGPDGTLRWSRQFGGASDDKPVAMAVDHAGTVIVVGLHGATVFERRYSAGGTLLGEVQWAGEPDLSPYLGVHDLTVDPAGHPVALFNGRVSTLSSVGVELSSMDVDPSAARIAIDADGTVDVAGSTGHVLDDTGSDVLSDAVVWSYTAGGALRWVRQFGSQLGDTPAGIALDPSGGLWVGVREDEGYWTSASVRHLGKNGMVGSSARVAGGQLGPDPQGVAVDASGTAYLVGGNYDDVDSLRLNGFVYAVAADGTPRWTRQLPVAEWAQAVAVSPSNRVAVVSAQYSTLGSIKNLVVRLYQPTPPTSVTTPLAPETLGSIHVAWHGERAFADLASYDVRYRRASWNGSFGAYVSWRNATVQTSATLATSPGSTYCVSSRARDKAGNVSAWSAQTCTVVPLDDRALKRVGSWTSLTGAAYYRGTASRSTVHGAKLVLAGASLNRVAIIASTCPTCGSVDVYWNGHKVQTLSLASATASDRVVFRPPFVLTGLHVGTLELRVASSGKPVVIDGVAIERSAPRLGADAAGGAWTAAGTLPNPRVTTALAGQDNGGLLALGTDDACLATPDSNQRSAVADGLGATWSAVTATLPQQGPAVAELPSGLVMVAGGAMPGDALTTGTSTAGASLYDPATGDWTPTADLATARTSAAAVGLADGGVLVAGGSVLDGTGISTPLASAERWDPVAKTWSSATPMPTAIDVPVATRLADGRVVVVGRTHGTPDHAVAVVYDPDLITWTAAVPADLYDASAAVAVAGDRVFVVDSGGSWAVFDPATLTWSASEWIYLRGWTSAARLGDGRVLVVDGWGTAFIWDPTTGIARFTTSIPDGRVRGSLISLADGSVLVAGGSTYLGGACPLPTDTTWRFTAP